MIKNIFKNKKRCIALLLVTATIHTMRKKIEKHEKEITNLANEIKELKSKGE